MVTDEQLSTRKYDRLRLRNFNEQKIENKQDKNGKRKKNEKLSHTIIFDFCGNQTLLSILQITYFHINDDFVKY